MIATQVRAVCFDVFGTLARITERRYPYRTLVRFLEEQGRFVGDDHVTVMTKDVPLEDLPAFLGYKLTEEQHATLRNEMAVELESIQLFDDALRALEVVRSMGLTIALCSNLAPSYGPAIRDLLPGLDHYVFSYEVGAIKPDPKIYAHLCQELGRHPEDTLMIGDSEHADYNGSRAFGLQGWHLSRNKESNAQHVLKSLDDLCEQLIQIAK